MHIKFKASINWQNYITCEIIGCRTEKQTLIKTKTPSRFNLKGLIYFLNPV